MRYGMITNLLWSWVFVMDGCNNMKVSAAYRYDAIQPTILQVSARVLHCMYIHSAAAHMHIVCTSTVLQHTCPLYVHPQCCSNTCTLYVHPQCCSTHAHWLLSENALHESILRYFSNHSVLLHLYLNHKLDISLCADPCMGHCHVFEK